MHECPGHEDCPRCDVIDPCPCCGIRYVNGEWVTTSSRFFWWRAEGLTYRWRPLHLRGIWHGDENCNRTIGVRLPGGMLHVCLNVPLRQQPHDECRMPA